MTKAREAETPELNVFNTLLCKHLLKEEGKLMPIGLCYDSCTPNVFSHK